MCGGPSSKIGLVIFAVVFFPFYVLFRAVTEYSFWCLLALIGFVILTHH